MCKWISERAVGEADPYDLARDPKGVWQWDQATYEFVQGNLVSLPEPTNMKSFFDVIEPRHCGFAVKSTAK